MPRRASALTWADLNSLVSKSFIDGIDRVNGATNAQSRLRLFGRPEAEASRVILYRDNHAWCPYCQKIWLWLEEKRIPYRVEKVTMFCYGDKEPWYTKKVPSGMLPALELDGRMVTESDTILCELERAFGPLGRSMNDAQVVYLRRLERLLFRAWCEWLCYPTTDKEYNRQALVAFEGVMQEVDDALSTSSGYFLGDFTTADVIFLPYVERMNASLYFYKGYCMRSRWPHFARWLSALESRDTYRGTQSDCHTHVHDLPPQMGGCYESGTPEQQRNKMKVIQGPWDDLPDTGLPPPPDARVEALHSVLRHRESIVAVNPGDGPIIDEALRAALTFLGTGDLVAPPRGSAGALRYIRDRISVPRDMSVWAARYMRHSLETIAALDGPECGPEVPFRHRRDQDPRPFARKG